MDKRRWRFYVTDFDDNDFYLGKNGEECDRREAGFTGTTNEAMNEADRRAYLWEVETGEIAARVTRESLG
jgi:hypothetical protein